MDQLNDLCFRCIQLKNLFLDIYTQTPSQDIAIRYHTCVKLTRNKQVMGEGVESLVSKSIVLINPGKCELSTSHSLLF